MSKRYLADLHIHVGSAGGKVVKVTASQEMTMKNIMDYAHKIKGLQIVGIVDCASPAVISELEEFIKQGKLAYQNGGGFIYEGKLLLFPGSEIELSIYGGKAHFIAYFPDLKTTKTFSNWVNHYTTNNTLSTQLVKTNISKIFEIVFSLKGVLIPAHAFTPFKSLLGTCIDDLSAFLKKHNLDFNAIELGLSADNYLADAVPQVQNYCYLSNSDAHSLPKIAREYNSFSMQNPSFICFKKLLRNASKKNIVNFGLPPQMGKYYRSYCPICDHTFLYEPAPVNSCLLCGHSKVVKGVLDRITEISDQSNAYFQHHPQCKYKNYYQRVLLEDVPGIGVKTYHDLLEKIGKELDVVHKADRKTLAQIVSKKAAVCIDKMRNGELEFIPGGGGYYGKIKS